MLEITEFWIYLDERVSRVCFPVYWMWDIREGIEFQGLKEFWPEQREG